MAKKRMTKKERRALRPRGIYTYLDMKDAAENAGWTGRSGGEYVHETAYGDIKMLHADVMPIRMIHFSNIPCGLFHPQTPSFCVVLLNSGEIKVYRHLVGECERCYYHRLTTTSSVRGVRAIRRGVKIRERNKHERNQEA